MIEHLFGPGIYISRHGECLANVEKRIIGVKDTPLTEVGINQAHDLGRRLREEKIDFIIASPLSRSFVTANIIGSYSDIPVVMLPHFRPQSFGVLEGYTKDEAFEKGLGEYLHTPYTDKYTHFVPKGETAQEAQNRIARVYPCLNNLVEQEDWTVLMVLHNSVIRSIVGSVWSLPPNEWTSLTVPNCGVFALSENYRKFIEVSLPDNDYSFDVSENGQQRIKACECAEWQKIIPLLVDETVLHAKVDHLKKQMKAVNDRDLSNGSKSLYNELSLSNIADHIKKSAQYEERIIREFILRGIL